jgi:hypothetical protein
MDALQAGAIGKIDSIPKVFRHLADLLNDTGAGEVSQTLSFAKDEEGLIPEVILRVRQPEEE